MKKLAPALIATAFLILSLFITAAIYLSLNYRGILEKVIGESLNAAVEIKEIDFDKVNNAIKLRNVSIHNPTGFNQKEILAVIPELTAYYEPHHLLKNNKIRLKNLVAYIKSITIIKGLDGKLNVEALKISDTDINLLPVCTDELILTLDNVIYIQLKQKGSPHVEIFEVKIKDKSYRDLEGIDHIAMRIVLDAVEKTTIKGTMFYASATLLGFSTGGAGLLTGTMVSKNNNSKTDFKNSFDNVYSASLETIKDITGSFKENKKGGVINTRLDDTAVVIKIKKLAPDKTRVIVYASQSPFMIPKPRTAKAILYQISQKLPGE